MRTVTELQTTGWTISTIQAGVETGRLALTEVDDDATQDFRCPAHQFRARPGSRPARLGGSAYLGELFRRRPGEDPAQPAADLLPAEGPGHGQPGDRPVPQPVRRPAASHRPAGRGLRRPLH